MIRLTGGAHRGPLSAIKRHQLVQQHMLSADSSPGGVQRPLALHHPDITLRWCWWCHFKRILGTAEDQGTAKRHTQQAISSDAQAAAYLDAAQHCCCCRAHVKGSGDSRLVEDFIDRAGRCIPVRFQRCRDMAHRIPQSTLENQHLADSTAAGQAPVRVIRARTAQQINITIGR